MSTQDLVEQLQGFLHDFDKEIAPVAKEIAINADKMKAACDKIRESWSGSCFGYHSKLYYGDFDKPPRGEHFSVEWGGINGFSQYWEERIPEEVKTKIAQLVGNNFSVDTFEKLNNELASKIEDFQTQVNLLIASVVSKESSNPLSRIEKIEPRGKLKSYIKRYMSSNMMTRDSEAVSQGIFTPAIIYYEAVVYDAESLVSNSEKLTKAIKHFIQWYKLQGNSTSSSNPSKPLLTDLSLLHKDIFSKCQRLFESGEYAEAVEKGFKVVRDRLRDLTGYETGSEAFGKGKFHIKGAAASNVDTDFNTGAKFLMMSIDMFRNEKSHSSNAKIDDPQQAYEYLTLSSLAMHLLDRSEITTT